MSCFDGLMDSFSKYAGLKWSMQMQSKYVACYKENRGELGVLMGEAMSTAATNISNGYSFKRACEGCFAVQCQPGTKTMQETIKFNNDLCDLYGLPRYETIYAATFGGSHST